jgi:outer membrane protein
LQKFVTLSLKALFLFLSFTTLSYAQITQSVEGKKQPLWEGGVAMVGALVPAYPASEDTNFFALPFPAFFYRGDVLRADEEGGMRGRFFKSSNLEVNLSIGGSLPANSKDVAIRQGMPDLKTMVEVGPGILSTLWKKKGDFNAKLGLNIPVRTALTVDFFEAKERGIVFNPLLYLITENLFADGLLSFTGLSTVFASHKFQKVFYQVDQQFAQPGRAAYGANSGYLGTTLSQGFARTLFKDTRAFIGGSYNYYKGSSNENSPLFRRKENFSVAIGLVWWFYESSTLENN